MGDRSVEEVRVAMALNGGVSLAIWMGGCAVEIDCARRADLGPEVIEGFPTRSVYAAICGALDRRLVVDVMSGSSAGGINGALLAAASVGRRRLHPDYLRTRWLELGDASRLLHPLTLGDPFSLMSGVYFHTELATFDAIRWEDRTEVDPEPLNAPAVEPPCWSPRPSSTSRRPTWRAPGGVSPTSGAGRSRRSSTVRASASARTRTTPRGSSRPPRARLPRSHSPSSRSRWTSRSDGPGGVHRGALGHRRRPAGQRTDRGGDRPDQARPAQGT